MLKRPGYDRPPMVPIGEADKGAFFKGGLEYNPPARGPWNIVHMGMLVPEAHQIYVCAQGCLRGVILTAAEMKALERLSCVSVSEEDMFDGTLEQDVIDGVCEIIDKLPRKPRAVLVFLSCIHLFAGCDQGLITEELRQRFPEIDFADCRMTPTMRQSMSPVVDLNIQMYSLIKPLPLDERSVSIVGCDRATDKDSELVRIIRENGFTLRDISLCQSYDEFMELGRSGLNISWLPAGAPASRALSQRTGAKELYLPNCFEPGRIRGCYRRLCAALGVELPDLSTQQKAAEAALDRALSVVGDTAVAIDFTAVTRPFELAKVLCERGFNVTSVVCDALGEDGDAFEWLQKERPELTIYSAVNVNMLFKSQEGRGDVLAIGQKAAFFFGTDRFVNIVSNAGLYGFKGLEKLAGMMIDAYENEKDRRQVIQLKGWGCESCLI